MNGATIVFLVTMVGSLFLAVRALRSHGLSLHDKAWMVVAWALIIAALALILGRIG